MVPQGGDHVTLPTNDGGSRAMYQMWRVAGAASTRPLRNKIVISPAPACNQGDSARHAFAAAFSDF